MFRNTSALAFTVCDNCLSAVSEADTCPEKRDVQWQADFAYWHGDIIAAHDCNGDCDCACNN